MVKIYIKGRAVVEWREIFRPGCVWSEKSHQNSSLGSSHQTVSQGQYWTPEDIMIRVPGYPFSSSCFCYFRTQGRLSGFWSKVQDFRRPCTPLTLVLSSLVFLVPHSVSLRPSTLIICILQQGPPIYKELITPFPLIHSYNARRL